MAAHGRATSLAGRPALPRQGMTLIELLIVLGILLTITSVTLRVMTPDIKSRRQREAARAISVYLASARSRAMETGRPCGVKFERLASQPQASVVVSQVETPPLYAGDTYDARCTVSGTSSSVTVTFAPAINANLVTKGASIQLNGQGGWYEVDNVTGATSLTAKGNGQATPWNGSQSVCFRIQRKPTKGATTPVQLPRGACVDLSGSGDDAGLNFANGTDPVIVTFAPSGALDKVWIADTPTNISNPIYFLIGTNDNLQNNALTYGNYWIGISPRSGLMTVAEVAATDSAANSRKFARDASAKGGR